MAQWCGRCGYLWQIRFASFPMDDEYLFRAAALLDKSIDWGEYLHKAESGDFVDTVDTLQRHQGTSRPLGGASFLDRLGDLLARDLKLKKPGRKRKRMARN